VRWIVDPTVAVADARTIEAVVPDEVVIDDDVAASP
jgi:hypothetical protein